MAYTPINWQTGDTITAEKLNKCDNGWSVETTSSTYYSGSITTESWGNYCGGVTDGLAEGISADTTVTVTFSGTDYALTIDSDGRCGALYNDGSDTYDFTTYPFGLYIYYSEFVSSYAIELYTESEGTYSLSIVMGNTTVEVSDNFQSAVNSFVDTSMVPMLCVSGTTTGAEMMRAYYSENRILYFISNDGYRCFITAYNHVDDDGNGTINFYPTNAHITASVTGGVFTVTESW